MMMQAFSVNMVGVLDNHEKKFNKNLRFGQFKSQIKHILLFVRLGWKCVIDILIKHEMTCRTRQFPTTRSFIHRM